MDLEIVDMSAPSPYVEITFQAMFLTGQFSQVLINLIFLHKTLFTSQDERRFTFLPACAFWDVL
jgi:hypothetical protein